MNSDPLEEARRRGFVRPTEPKEPEETGTNFWLAVLLAFIAFVILVDPLFRFDLPFVGK